MITLDYKLHQDVELMLLRSLVEREEHPLCSSIATDIIRLVDEAYDCKKR